MAWNSAILLVALVAGVLEIRHAASDESSYLNQWAVHIPGGQDVAQRVANELGYINHGQVSWQPNPRFLIVITVQTSDGCPNILSSSQTVKMG